MRSALILTTLLFPFLAFAQDEPFGLPHVEREPVFDIAPRFPGGSDAMMRYFADSVRYPEPELSQRKGGYVMVAFTVSRKGRISGARVVNGVAGAPHLAAEAIRLLEAMPRWEPALKKGKAVDAEMRLSIPFDPVRKGRRPR